MVWNSQHMTSTFNYHIVPFQIPIYFVWRRFSFKGLITCTRGTIKILNAMVFHFSNLVLMYIWIQNNQLNVRLIILLISMSCFIFLGGLRICCLNCLYGSIFCPMYILLLFWHLMLYTKWSYMLFKELLPFFYFCTTLFVGGFFLLFFDPKGRPQFFFRLVGLSFSWISIGLACLFFFSNA